jgi:hypothetical protein
MNKNIYKINREKQITNTNVQLDIFAKCTVVGFHNIKAVRPYQWA